LTVTATAHGLIVGSSVNLDFTTGTGLDGVYTVVTVADADTFTITTVASTTTSGNVTILRNTIRASGNVTSITDNGVGDYTVNLTTALSDINYSVALSASANYGVDRKTYPALFTNISAATEVAPTTSAFRVGFSNAAGGAGRDEKYICVSVFR
jgi:hypothetical protein